MPRIRCHYADCVFLDEGYCAAAATELDPEEGCLTYSPTGEVEAEDAGRGMSFWRRIGRRRDLSRKAKRRKIGEMTMWKMRSLKKMMMDNEERINPERDRSFYSPLFCFSTSTA